MRYLFIGDRDFKQMNKSKKYPIYFNKENNVAIIMNCAGAYWNFNMVAELLPNEKLCDRLINTLANDFDTVIYLRKFPTDSFPHITTYRNIEIEDADYVLRSMDRAVEYLQDNFNWSNRCISRYKDVVGGLAVDIMPHLEYTE